MLPQAWRPSTSWGAPRRPGRRIGHLDLKMEPVTPEKRRRKRRRLASLTETLDQATAKSAQAQAPAGVFSQRYPPSIIAFSNVSCLPSVRRMAMRRRGETMRHPSPEI